MDAVSLRIARYERIAVLGKSGCGKSTLLNLIGGLDWPSAGTIAVHGMVLSQMRSDQLAAYRRHQVGMVFQSYNLIASRTALENVELPAIFAGCRTAPRRRAAIEALTAVGLGQRLSHRPTELSGGEQQRVAIARALINRPPLLLADEPTGNLDTQTADEIVHLLEESVKTAGMTLIFVTHDEQLARRLATRIVRMADGRIVEIQSQEASCV